MDLSGQTAIVTGGASGIGEAIVCRLTSAGARVRTRFCTGGNLNGQARFLRADVTSEDDIARLIKEAATGDKTSRVFGASGMIEAGRLFIPDRGHWVAEYKGELLGFPGAAFDDQVDATTQLLLWVQEKDRYRVPLNAGPELIECDGEYDIGDGFSGFDDPWL